LLFLEVNNPKSTIDLLLNTQNLVINSPTNVPNKPVVENGVSSIEVRDYLIVLEKHLGNVLKSKPSTKGMSNMGIKWIIFLFL